MTMKFLLNSAFILACFYVLLTEARIFKNRIYGDEEEMPTERDFEEEEMTNLRDFGDGEESRGNTIDDDKPFPGGKTDDDDMKPFPGGKTDDDDMKPFPGGKTDDDDMKPFPGGQTDDDDMKPFPGGQTDDDDMKPFPGGKTDDDDMKPFPGGKTDDMKPFPGGKTDDMKPFPGGKTDDMKPFPGSKTDDDDMKPFPGGKSDDDDMKPFPGGKSDDDDMKPFPGGKSDDDDMKPFPGGKSDDDDMKPFPGGKSDDDDMKPFPGGKSDDEQNDRMVMRDEDKRYRDDRSYTDDEERMIVMRDFDDDDDDDDSLPTDLPPAGVIYHRLRSTCPVMSEILPYYFEHFPSGPMKDSMDIEPKMFQEKLRSLYNIFRISGNTRLFIRELTSEMAETLIHARFNCTTTKLQQAFVYLLRRELDDSLSKRDNSLRSQLQVWVDKIMKDDYAEDWTRAIVHETHQILYEQVIGSVQMQEFKGFSKVFEEMSAVLKRKVKKSKIEDLQMWLTKFFQMQDNKVGILQCTPGDVFMKRQITIAQKFQQRMTRDILTKETTVLVEQLIGKALTEMGIEPSKWQNEIDGILNVLTDYGKGTVEYFKQYEQFLTTRTAPWKNDQDLQRYLSSEEITYYQNLWNHFLTTLNGKNTT